MMNRELIVSTAEIRPAPTNARCTDYEPGKDKRNRQAHMGQNKQDTRRDTAEYLARPAQLVPWPGMSVCTTPNRTATAIAPSSREESTVVAIVCKPSVAPP